MISEDAHSSSGAQLGFLGLGILFACGNSGISNDRHTENGTTPFLTLPLFRNRVLTTL